MNGGVEGLVRRWWAGEAGPVGRVLDLAGVPLSHLWGAAVAMRNTRYDRRGGTVVPGLPVVSIGNLSVGGTGKTPISAWVAAHLASVGAHPALLLRGYGRDEVLLHRRWNPAVPVFEGSDRVAAARRARDAGAGVAVLDDGFQHRRLARALDWVLIAVEESARARLLPAGPLREPLGSLTRSSGVILVRRTAPESASRELERVLDRLVPGIVRAGAVLGVGGWRDLAGGPIAGEVRGRVLAVASVARPEEFRRMVLERGAGEVGLLAFRDHHEYDRRDVRRIAEQAGGRLIVTTEKDAVKLEAFAEELGEVRVMALEVRWDWGGERIRAELDAIARGAQRT